MSTNLAFYQLDDQAALSHLKSIRNKLEPFIDEVLDKFYDYIQQNPELKEILSGSNIENLKKAQKTHWLNAMESGLNEEYLATVRRIGNAHVRINLRPFYYMGGYSFIIDQVMSLSISQTNGMFSKNSTFPVLSNEDLRVFMRFLMYDMALSIEVYQEGKDHTKNVLETSINFLEKLNGELEHTASSVTEMSSTVREISDQATQAQDHSSNVSEKMNAVNDGMADLETSSNKIGDVLNIIQEISDKINLLSLNAAIEAARAGEHGRGFAVVADEIKKLATGTNKSIDDINEQIKTIQERIQHSSKDVDNVTEAIKQIEEINTSITAAVTEQSSATEEMESFVQELLENSNKTSEQLNQKIVAGTA